VEKKEFRKSVSARQLVATLRLVVSAGRIGSAPSSEETMHGHDIS
jgi:hypothetical protein